MNIGLLGHGTIGIGVDRIIKKRNDMKVTRVMSLVVDDEIEGRLAETIDDIVNDPEIDTVVEVMGGVHPAFEFVSAALKHGKNAVTANKALVAACYEELLALAEENHVSFRCTAAVGGSIPWLVNIERANRVDRIEALGGIMNGTTNFIMSAMTNEGADFSETLKKAQELGYAEKDPSADIDGPDVRRKLNISVNAAFGVITSEDEIPTYGIRSVTAADVRNASSMGRTIKLIASSEMKDGVISAVVEPTLLTSDDLKAAIPSNFNLVWYRGAYCGEQCFTGQGAGRFPTAYNVVEDLVDIQAQHPGFYTEGRKHASIDNSNVLRSYYVRSAASDEYLASVTETVCDGYVITKPVRVSEMHEYLKKQTENGNDIFAASL